MHCFRDEPMQGAAETHVATHPSLSLSSLSFQTPVGIPTSERYHEESASTPLLGTFTLKPCLRTPFSGTALSHTASQLSSSVSCNLFLSFTSLQHGDCTGRRHGDGRCCLQPPLPWSAPRSSSCSLALIPPRSEHSPSPPSLAARCPDLT